MWADVGGEEVQVVVRTHARIDSPMGKVVAWWDDARRLHVDAIGAAMAGEFVAPMVHLRSMVGELDAELGDGAVLLRHGDAGLRLYSSEVCSERQMALGAAAVNGWIVAVVYAPARSAHPEAAPASETTADGL